MSENKDATLKYTDQIEWIRINQETYVEEEPPLQKLIRKVKVNPFVPIGAVATIAALSYGLWNCVRGNAKMSQYMMRTRVATQGFTIAAVVIGLMLTAANRRTKST